MNHRQYLLLCQNSPELENLEPQEYETLPYPHPYIEIWMLCLKYRTPGGGPLLPEPDKGILEQDADLMIAFEVLEEIAKEQEEETAAKERNRELARQMHFQM